MSLRLHIDHDYSGDAFVNSVPADRVIAFTAGPDGLTCYVEGDDGFYAGSVKRGRLTLERVGAA